MLKDKNNEISQLDSFSREKVKEAFDLTKSKFSEKMMSEFIKVHRDNIVHSIKDKIMNTHSKSNSISDLSVKKSEGNESDNENEKIRTMKENLKKK